MLNTELAPLAKAEALLAELAAATFRVAKQHGFQDAFIDIELDLWDAHQATSQRPRRTSPAGSGAGSLANCH